MEFDKPDEAAYGRITNPERFKSVVDAAEALVARVVADYDVTTVLGTAEIEFPESRESATSTTRLIPAEGVSLVFMITDLPGVALRFGAHGYHRSFPGCGCDACDEDSTQVIEELHWAVNAALTGSYREILKRRSLETRYFGDFGSCGQRRGLERGEWRAYGELGEKSFRAWPRRGL